MHILLQSLQGLVVRDFQMVKQLVRQLHEVLIQFVATTLISLPGFVHAILNKDHLDIGFQESQNTPENDFFNGIGSGLAFANFALAPGSIS